MSRSHAAPENGGSQRSQVLTQLARTGQQLAADARTNGWSVTATSFRADGSFVYVVKGGISDHLAISTYLSIRQDTEDLDIFEVLIQEAQESPEDADLLSRTTKTSLSTTISHSEVGTLLDGVYPSVLSKFLSRLELMYSH